MPFRPTAFRLNSHSSNRWLARQNRDPYVRQRLSHPAGYRSRAAFKLLEIDAQHNFLSHPDVRAVVDLGAAPGGWSQVVAERFGLNNLGSEDPAHESMNDEDDIWAMPVAPTEENTGAKKTRSRKERLQERNAKRAQEREDDGIVDETPRHLGRGRGRKDRPELSDIAEPTESIPPRPDPGLMHSTIPRTIAALDLLRMEPIPGVHTLQTNFLSPPASIALRKLLRTPQNPSGRADVILSDMAANVTGHRDADVQSSLDIASAVWEFAKTHLRTEEEVGRPNAGVLLIKHFAHPLLDRFREELEPHFRHVAYIKPDSSRSGSSEGYWLCYGFEGARYGLRGSVI